MDRGIPIISSLGTGNKFDPSQFEITDISKTKNCPLARVMRKELTVGVLAGSVVGVATFLKVVLIDRFLLGNPAVSVTVALVVAVSLALTIIFAKLIGAALPILAKKLGFDPAVMASPFITTLVDAASLVIYFLIAANTLAF